MEKPSLLTISYTLFVSHHADFTCLDKKSHN